MNKWFNDFATKTSNITGRSYAFFIAAMLIVVWLLSGPILGFSDTWQLLINTLTTLVTFLMVFIIQNSQNRSNNAQQIKLDFILQILGVDDKELPKLETLDDKELEKFLDEVQNRTRSVLTNGRSRKTRTKR